MRIKVNKASSSRMLVLKVQICSKVIDILGNQFSPVQLLSCVRLSSTPWIAACQASLSITNSQSLLKLMSIKSVNTSNSLSSPYLPLISLSIRVFSNESVLQIRWPKYWSFSFSISPSNEYSGLISFRMDWLDLLTLQGTLKSFLQHHSSKASILFFFLQLNTYINRGSRCLRCLYECVLCILTHLSSVWCNFFSSADKIIPK